MATNNPFPNIPNQEKTPEQLLAVRAKWWRTRLEDLSKEFSVAINLTPTGDLRNTLTDANIHVMAAIADLDVVK